MTFEDDDSDDPHSMLKQFYFIHISIVAEVNCGVDNLWKRSKSKGRSFYPMFRKCECNNYFKSLIYASPRFFT